MQILSLSFSPSAEVVVVTRWMRMASQGELRSRATRLTGIRAVPALFHATEANPILSQRHWLPLFSSSSYTLSKFIHLRKFYSVNSLLRIFKKIISECWILLKAHLTTIRITKLVFFTLPPFISLCAVVSN